MADFTVYYRYDNGAYSATTYEGMEPSDVVPPEGATEITQQEYEDGVAEVEAANAAAAAELEAADRQRACDDYAALIAAGVPEATARRMSGCVEVPVVDPS